MAAEGNNTIGVGISIGSEVAALAIVPTATRDDQFRISNLAALRPNIIAAEGGERTTPAYVAYASGEQVVGGPAKAAYVRTPLNTIHNIVPILGGKNEFASLVPTDIEYNDDGEAIATSMDNEEEEPIPHPVSECLTALLSHLCTLAVDAAGGRTLGTIAVSVPRYVDTAAVQSAVDAAQLPANSVRIVYDDCSAALAQGVVGPSWKTTESDGALIVVDWGATVAQVTVFDATGGSLSLLSSEYSTAIGGKQIDRGIAKLLIGNFKRKTRMDPGEGGRPMRKLLGAAERVKITLSSSQSAGVEVDAFFEGMDLMDNMTRGKLDQVIGELQLVSKLEELIRKAWSSANTNLKVRHVVLTGGTTKIPSLTTALKSRVVPSLFGTDASVLSTVAGDEAPAYGASLHAALCNAPHSEYRRHALPYTLGLCTSEESPESPLGSGDMLVLASRGTPLPLQLTLDLGEEEGDGRTLLLLGQLPPGGGEDSERIVPLSESIVVPAQTAALTLYLTTNGTVEVLDGKSGKTLHTIEAAE